MRMLTRGLAIVALLAATSCTKPWSSTDEYTCADGYAFTIRYAGTDQPGDVALFEDGERSVKLPRAPSASGERYSNEAIEFFARGDEALVREGGAVVHRDCSTRPPDDE